MENTKEKSLLNFQYSNENKEKLKELAKLDRRTLSSYLMVLLDNHIKANEHLLKGVENDK